MVADAEVLLLREGASPSAGRKLAVCSSFVAFSLMSPNLNQQPLAWYAAITLAGVFRSREDEDREATGIEEALLRNRGDN